MSGQLRTDKGFTLVELLVVMVVSGIVMIGVVAVFGNQTRATALQEDYVALEQNLRSAMDFIHRDSRIAGAYTKDALAPFTIGAIDYNADGSTDFNSEGGGSNPDAIQVRYSPNPGLLIVTHPSPSSVNLDICAHSGLASGQILVLSSSSNPPDVRAIQITNVNNGNDDTGDGVPDGTHCPGKPCEVVAGIAQPRCDSINFSPGPSPLNSPGGLGTPYVNGRIWDKLETITYFQTDDADGNGTPDDPALMRVRNQGAPAIVAFGITDFQAVYILRSGAETTAPVLPPPTAAQTIERIRLTVTGETRNAHSLAGGAPSKRTRTMTTEVQIRNLAF